jgi:hypothetical protein
MCTFRIPREISKSTGKRNKELPSTLYLLRHLLFHGNTPAVHLHLAVKIILTRCHGR